MQNRAFELFCAVQKLIVCLWEFADNPARGLTMYKPQGRMPLPDPSQHRLKDGMCLIMRRHFVVGIATPWGLVKVDSHDTAGSWHNWLSDLIGELKLRPIAMDGDLTFYRVGEAFSPQWASECLAASANRLLIQWWIMVADYQICLLMQNEQDLRAAV
jgi:hypothetical protein